MFIMVDLKKKKKLILVSVLSAVLLALVLALGLGLGLQLRDCRAKEPTSCRNRCFEPYDQESAACRCDEECVVNNNCCYDYHDICLQPTESWECTALRCGEKRVSTSKCHCSDDCVLTGDCCSNYNSVCQGETQWVEDKCEDMSVARCPAGFKRQPLLLVSLDGLRAEYLQTWSSLIPVLDKMRRCGTSSPFMQPVFPSKTFPNHYSIVTGMYAESHGLVDNDMYDPVFDASFTLSGSEKDNPRWYQGQPIWNTVMYQGLKAGTFFWPGSDVAINESFPNIYMKYDGKVPFQQRVFTVLQWLQLPDEQRPDFLTLYLEEPDKSGHSHGPISGGVVSALQAVDRVMGHLMNGLKQLQLHQCVNVIVVADHGMEETSCERKEVLQDLVGDISRLYVHEGPFGRIRARDNTHTLDGPALVANMSCKAPQQQVVPYLKQHLPKRFHYANNRRIEDVTVMVKPRWLFERYPGSLTFCSGGTHGYDNDVFSMQAVFLALGPKFLSQTEVEPFSNIELYNLMCGTPHTDTVCEGCGDGQFAEAASPCVNHSACASDQHLLVAGSRRHDAVCARCEQMTAAGWGKLFRPFLSDLLARRLPTRRTRTLLAEKLRLLERQGPDDEMLMLPQLLKQSRLHHLADKVSSKIRHFQKLVSRCLAPP